MDAPGRLWQNLPLPPKHVKRANHLIRRATKGSRSARPKGGRLCSAFVRGTCRAPAQWREHPSCRSVPRPVRARAARKRAERPQHDHVQWLFAQGASLTRSARGLASSDFAVRDSTCRRFPGLFPSKRVLDSTRRLAARVSVLRRDAPARSTAGQSRCRRR